MNNNTYDKIKLTALIIAPILVFLGSIAIIWKVPHAQEITATLAALDTCIGTIVTILSRRYNKMIDDYEEADSEELGEYEEEDYELLDDYEEEEESEV